MGAAQGAPSVPNMSHDDASADSASTTIVLADDHVVVRHGLRLVLEGEEDLRVVAEAGNVTDALRYVRAHRPSVLILDLNMPGEPSLPAIPQFLEGSPETAIVVLTMQEDPAFAREALRSGALGYVLKESADDELVEAVRGAARGWRPSRRSPRGRPTISASARSRSCASSPSAIRTRRSASSSSSASGR